MKLSRKWARIICALLALAVMFALFPAGMYYLAGGRSPDWYLLGLLGALGCLIAGVILRRRHLVCPHCGRGFARPGWKTGEREYCPACGRPFFYDDEPEDESEEY